ncbi:MAG: phage putative head morphogenesis protein, SPP1 gp7 family [Clostridium sp. Maddingley MBC34-26]|nr:MAG: phage putative head morphogenesis protein, SPP1 gp7 family [Clostridium sp. Maddingley MBC34-26]
MIYERLKSELHGPLNAALNFEIQKNAEIIKSIPLNISKEVTEHILNESMSGRRASNIAEDLQEMIPKLTKSKAKLIARTETSKTSTALTKARCESLGINWYIWRTSEDRRVRSSHSHMEGVLVCWNNPPSPEALTNEKNVGFYHAGDIYNCRCYPQPVIKLDYIKWPQKVYYNGQIITMTRKQFESIM